MAWGPGSRGGFFAPPLRALCPIPCWPSFLRPSLPRSRRAPSASPGLAPAQGGVASGLPCSVPLFFSWTRRLSCTASCGCWEARGRGHLAARPGQAWQKADAVAATPGGLPLLLSHCVLDISGGGITVSPLTPLPSPSATPRAGLSAPVLPSTRSSRLPTPQRRTRGSERQRPPSLVCGTLRGGRVLLLGAEATKASPLPLSLCCELTCSFCAATWGREEQPRLGTEADRAQLCGLSTVRPLCGLGVLAPACRLVTTMK